MQRCLQLAKKGLGSVSPNPMVGCVIVYNNKIIGEGFHQNYGDAHAEVNAINSVQNKALLKKSTLYVNLEPCAHFGKTPPCANLIAEKQIPHVVIGCVDIFSEVSGKGIEKLKFSGIDVTLGVLEKESQYLNRRFFTFHNKKRPYVILKWAQSKDGFIDKHRGENDKGINWITQPETKQLTHLWRSHEDAVLVGKNTVLTDNPSLTTRAVKGKNPMRIVLGKQEDIPSNYKIFGAESKTFFLQGDSAMILQELYQKNIQSVIVEGGKHVLEQFISLNLWDEARILTGEVSFEKGIKAPIISQNPTKTETHGKDTINYYKNA